MAKRRSDDARDMLVLKSELKQMEPREWWMWVIERRGHAEESRRRVCTLMARLPYVRPVDEPAWGALWPTTVIDHDPLRRALYAFFEERLSEAALRISTLERITGVHASDKSLGSMLSLVVDDIGSRGGPYTFLFTPPVYEFCNLETEFSNINAEVKPHDFWIQPEVYEATGEILQGSPVDKANLGNYGAGLERGMHIQRRSSLETDEPDYEQYMGYVRIALDAFLQQGVPDPRFVVGWEERRRRAAEEHGKQCQFHRMSGHHDEEPCKRPPTHFVRLPTMQTLEPVCTPHAEELAAEGYVFGGMPKQNPRRNPHPGVDSEGAMRAMRIFVQLSVVNPDSEKWVSQPVTVDDLTDARMRIIGTGGPKVRDDQRAIVERYLQYFVDKDLVLTGGVRGEAYTLSAKALSYSNRNVARWPDWRKSAAGQSVAIAQSFKSHELERYLKTFIGNAWSIEIPISNRMEISTDASEYALAIELHERRDSQWPSINTFVVSTQDPMSRPIDAGPVQPPIDMNIAARSWPYSPMEFVAMVLPFTDVYHP